MGRFDLTDIQAQIYVLHHADFLYALFRDTKNCFLHLYKHIYVKMLVILSTSPTHLWKAVLRV